MVLRLSLLDKALSMIEKNRNQIQPHIQKYRQTLKKHRHLDLVMAIVEHDFPLSLRNGQKYPDFLLSPPFKIFVNEFVCNTSIKNSFIRSVTYSLYDLISPPHLIML